MGDQSCIISTIMKFFIVSALVAAVSAEAQYFGGYPSAYSGLVGGYPYSGLAGGYPYTSAYSGYPYSGKRSADAEPEADAQYLASPYAGFGAYNGLYGLGAYSYSAPALNYGLAYNGLYNGLYSRGYAAAGAPFTGCRNYVGAPVPC